MLTDRYGLAISTSSQAARDDYVAGCDCILAAAPDGAKKLEAAITADPDFALAYVALARERFLFADIPGARNAIAKARELAPRTSPREQAHIDALSLGMEGKPVEAFAATQKHLKDYPRDAMVAAPATGVFGLIGFSGRQGREPEQLAFLESLKPHLADDWWFQMVYAFALEEMGLLDQAMQEIDHSLAVNPRSAHGAHIKAHVLYEMGEDRAALDYLQGWLPGYAREGLMHCHISWHIAMFALTLGRSEDAWRVYRQQVHPGGAWGPALNVVTDSVAFLWRAELAGEHRRDEMWKEIHEYALKSFPKTGIAFIDVHSATACIANDDQAGLARIAQELEERLASGRYPAGSVVSTLARGFAAYRSGDWSKAAEILGEARTQTVRIGGSRAQRDLIDCTLLAAYLKAGRADAARAMIAARADRKPSNPVAGLH